MKKKVGCKEKEGPWVPLKPRLGKLLESSPKLDHNIINAIPISPNLEWPKPPSPTVLLQDYEKSHIRLKPNLDSTGQLNLFAKPIQDFPLDAQKMKRLKKL